ncbi:MAG: GTPase HflX [Candidatus Omnitrophica bacterium]|nr:GTPase HflX [Candidatus Omnitrophota bacterium]
MKYKEKAILAVLDTGKSGNWPAEELMDELKTLTLSCGAEIAGEVTARRDKPDPAYFVGKGKAQEIVLLAAEVEADVVIFNDDLSAAQKGSLERIINGRVIDRTQLILDIFAGRAKSIEGKVQVELAQLQYLLPRLTGKGDELSRLGGGIGTRGPGEQKLEVDRRRIQKRISKLKKDLKKIEKRRQNLRDKRKRNHISTIALVGYTNSGKSTLLNALTASNQITRDKLFSTLDPKVKKLILPNKQSVLIADTVGFLHDLPHHLIESFKATLEEAVEADILLHILDASSPRARELKESVYNVLCELKALDKPIITALNKIDKTASEVMVDSFVKSTDNCVGISALYKENLDELLHIIEQSLAALRTHIKLLIPHQKMSLIDLIYKDGNVIKKEYAPEGVYLEADVSVVLAKKLKKIASTKHTLPSIS